MALRRTLGSQPNVAGAGRTYGEPVVGRRVGRYRIVAPLGSGGMASVWKAEDALLSRTVAVKILDESLSRDEIPRRRFLREARTGATLDHPSIAAVYDVGESDGIVFFTLAYVDGHTLSAHAARGPLEIREVVRIGVAAGEALAYAHAQGVLHRDVTGRNVMIAREGRVFVLDFGLALARDQSRLTPKDTAIGTVAYVAPEVALLQPADVRSEVYSLGVVLYEIATGTLPFSGEYLDGVLYTVLHGSLEPPGRRRADMPAALERIILRAMDRNPALRYQSISDMVAELRALDRAPDPGGINEPVEPVIRSFESEPASGSSELPSPLYLAVLPFDAADASENPSEERTSITLGLAEAVAVALGQVESVHIIPPGACRSAPGGDLGRLARHLGANLLLNASVRLSSADMRISYSLHHPSRGVQIAAGTIEGARAELFLLEDRLITEILEHLKLQPEVRRQIQRLRPDPAARERYLQALGYLQRYDHEVSIDGAIRLLEDLVTREPENASYHAGLGRAYLQKYRLTEEGNWHTKAAASCQRALALAADSADVLISLGELHFVAGNHDKAIEEFEAAIAKRPESAGAYSDLGRALEASGRRDEAERACRQAIALQPDYWAHYNRLGLVLFNQGRYAEAADTWKRVTELSPDNAMGHWNLAGALFRLDRLEESVEMYRRSIQIEPTSRTYRSLGTALYWMGRYDQALEALRICVALAPRDPDMWGTLANAYRWTPGYESQAPEALDRAIALMRRRFERTAGSAKEWADLASLYANRGLNREAAEAIEHAARLPSFDLNCMAIAGSVFHSLGRRDDALRWIGQAIDLGYGVVRLKRDPVLKDLQDDPEFKRILARARQAPAGTTPSRLGNGGG